MAQTEAEHRKLICPIMTQHVAAQLNGTPHCCGSDCALWRWKRNWQFSRAPRVKWEGFCGLVKDSRDEHEL